MAISQWYPLFSIILLWARHNCIPAKGSKAFVMLRHLAIACPLKPGEGNTWELLQSQPHLLKSPLISSNLELVYTKNTTWRSNWAPFSSQRQLNLQSHHGSVQGCQPSFSLMMACALLMQHLLLKLWSKNPPSAEPAWLPLHLQYNYSCSAATWAVLYDKTVLAGILKNILVP